MNKLFFLLSFVVSAIVVHAQDKPVPEKLKPFVSPDYEMLDYANSDMNGDGLQDYILILKPVGEDTMTFDNPHWDAPRILWMIVGEKGGKLKPLFSNSELVMCRQCGGAMGDPFESIKAKPGVLTLDFYGGSSWRWAETITFMYDKLKKNWFLQTHSISSFQAGDPETTTKNAVIERSEIGDVTLEKYEPYYNADSSKWKVKAAKSYFYDSPGLKSKPGKAYVLKGDTVAGSKAFKNFIECSFTNSKGTLTYGYILRKDLVAIK
jgi:hypothetical protein